MGKQPAPFALIGLLVASCGFVPSPTPSAGPPSAPPFDVLIETPDGPVGLTRSGSSIGLYLHSSDGGTYNVTSTPTGSAPTVHLYAQGGETGRQWNTFVFGEAPVGAMAIQVNGSRAAVRDGLYVVGLAVRELPPDALVWSFLGVGDGVIAQGSGLRN